MEKTDVAGTIRYLVDPNRSLAQVLAEYTPAGVLLASYVYADDLLSVSRGGETVFYHADALGSTRLLTDLASAVSDTYDYDAFGTLTLRAGATQNPFLFAGQGLNFGQGIYYLRARLYQTTTGRFLSRDPEEGLAEIPQTLHSCVYALGDPVDLTDPSGAHTLQDVVITFDAQGKIRVPQTGAAQVTLQKCIEMLSPSTRPCCSRSWEDSRGAEPLYRAVLLVVTLP